MREREKREREKLESAIDEHIPSFPSKTLFFSSKKSKSLNQTPRGSLLTLKCYDNDTYKDDLCVHIFIKKWIISSASPWMAGVYRRIRTRLFVLLKFLPSPAIEISKARKNCLRQQRRLWQIEYDTSFYTISITIWFICHRNNGKVNECRR